MRREFETLAAFAKRRGVSKACVTKWKRRGLVRTDARGLVDVAASEALLADRPATYRGGSVKTKTTKRSVEADQPGTDPTTWSTAEAVRQKEIAQARLRQIEADQAAGAVVPVSEICRTVAAEYAVVRTTLLAMPAKLAHRLAAAETAAEAGALVDSEVRAALEALTADSDVPAAR
jgi:hypothetical protein